MIDPTRRSFLEAAVAAPIAAETSLAAAPASPQDRPAVLSNDSLHRVTADKSDARWWPHIVDLAPARWIWMPSQRVLPNTFALFRREITLREKPKQAFVWIAADSRYRLTVNGERVQWGPAPCDPRRLDADPADISALLKKGENVIGVEVLFYGFAEGTWPGGKPGLLLLASIEMPDGTRETIGSDAKWAVMVDRAHRPGQPKRWFLRSLQETFDARLHPYGWDAAGYKPGPEWLPPQLLDCGADRPAACTRSGPWAFDTVDRVNPDVSSLRLRQIPPVRESLVSPFQLAECGIVEWVRDPNDWFDFRVPGSFRIRRDQSAAREVSTGRWQLAPTPEGQGVYATFEFHEQIVGTPFFTIDAPAGTIVELMWQEAHDSQKTQWLDSQFFNWSRFTCREGENHFEAFDYESLRWLQVHVRSASRPVTVSNVGVRRRQFDWPHEPEVRTSEAALQKLLDASINTVRNSAIETIVDGMARERQQYSGDCGHQLHAVRSVFGEPRLGRRYLRTFSEGSSKTGYFFDSWPAADRLTRVAQKEMDAAYWGPILDHGIGFNFDCWNHYLETGEREAIREPYPRLVHFADYLWSLRQSDGLLPVENLGIPTVWMDHQAYENQRQRQCAFNLYAAAMYRHALAQLAEVMGDPERVRTSKKMSDELLSATVKRFWSAKHGLFVNNLPWVAEEKGIRMCDRSLATAILFDQCPGGNIAASVKALAECPREMGFSYPANQNWRLWALGKARRADVIVDDLRKRWAVLPSVAENNSLQEDWQVRRDSTSQWSHCPVVPLYVTWMELAGIRPLTPGFARMQIRPQLADLPDLALTAWTPLGPVRFSAKAEAGGHRVRIELPEKADAELVVPAASRVDTKPVGAAGAGLVRYPLKGGTIEFLLRS